MILYETKYLTFKSVERGDKAGWVYVTRDNAKNIVAILPVIKKDDEDEVLFLITNRPPLEAEGIAKFSVEIPAGLVGDEVENETTLDAMKKELLEETGLVADEIKICVNKVSSSGGLTDETTTIGIATITDSTLKSTPVSDGGVILNRIYVKKSDIRKFLIESEEKGYAISSQTLAALYYLE